MYFADKTKQMDEKSVPVIQDSGRLAKTRRRKAAAVTKADGW